MDLAGVLLGLFMILVVLLVNRLRRKPVPLQQPKFSVGDITAETLATYCGYDYMKPILIAIRGVVYDVTQQADVYGPGNAYAGKEISRALALGSIKPGDIGSAQLGDLGEQELQRLETRVKQMMQQHMDAVGQVVALRQMTVEELSIHDGSRPDLPLCLAIQGVVYDISKGRQFYGPDGVYPFAGRECARALALLSTEVSDCNSDPEGLSYTELENLRDWKNKFNIKYPIIGKIVALFE